MPWGMPRPGIDLDKLVAPVRATAYQVGFSVLENRNHAFAERSKLRRSLLRIGVDFRKIINVGLREDVARIWEGWHPFAIALLRVPADMIVVQVCAHHEINFLGPHACGGEPFEIRYIKHVPERPAGFHLVVAAA